MASGLVSTVASVLVWSVVVLLPVAVVWVADDLEVFRLGAQVLAAYDQAVVDSVADNNLVPSTMGHNIQNYNKLNRVHYYHHSLKNNWR